jgi:hypothetical protein
MHDQIRLVIATTLSMIITFGFYCGIETLTVRDSLVKQIFIDYLRDCALIVRCVYSGCQSKYY